MKKHRHHHRSRTPYRADTNNAQRIHGNFYTIIYNLTALLVYGIFFKFSFDGTLALIMFSVLATLQLIVCAIIGFNYNNKIWLVSALMIFLIACAILAYESI